MIRRLNILIIVCLFSLNLTGQENLSIAGFPSVFLPLNESADIYEMGMGGGAEISAPLFGSRLNFHGTLDFQAVNLQAGAGELQIIAGGAGISYPLLNIQQFSLGPQINLGGYMGISSETDSTYNPYYSAAIRGDLAINDGFTISLKPEYRDMITRQDGAIESFYSGVSVSLQLSVSPSRLSSGTRRPQLQIIDPEYRQIFPVIYKYYDENPIGNVLIQNREKRRIQDVQVFFYVPRYMDGPQIIAEYDEISSGDEIEIPITALFNSSVMDITEQDTVQSQVSVTYSVGDTSLTAERNRSIRIYDRNSISWDDDRKAAAFVTAKDPTILKFSRNVTSELGSASYAGLSSNLASAIAVFEALKEYGLEYTIDPDSSYELLSQDESSTDYLQFPVQTLDYRTGDCDDLSILYSSMLEAVAIETAFVTTPGHIYLAFSLNMSEQEALRMFRSTDDLILHEGEAWLPVEVTMVNDGFVDAWETGARQWREAQADGAAGFFPIREAWSVYAPTGFSSGEVESVVERLPAANSFDDEYRDSLNQFIQIQIAPMVERLEAGIAQRSSPRLINRLGTLYARYGLVDEAEQYFRQAANLSYLPAMVNMGNIHYINEDYNRALAFYQQAHNMNPDNTDVLLSLARTNYAIEQYGEAREYYQVAQLLDPVRAEDYAYISGGNSQTARASDISARSKPIWSDE